MTTIDRSALLPHAAEHLYALVADIERYPEFLDGCVGAEIISHVDNLVTARLKLSRAGLSHSFVTRNTMQAPEMIGLELVDGPFERFAGQWRFDALAEDACKVSLRLDFRMRSGLVHAAAGKLFDRVAVDMVDAVVRRAAVLGASR
jgi:ribosome-associated toxin RatA of RatAB toxin-antitoxin module